MSQGRLWHSLRQVTGVLAIVGLLVIPTLATAQDQPAAQNEPVLENPNTGAIKLDISVDWVSEYVWRGMLRKNEGLIFQPSATVTAKLYESEDLLRSLDVFASIWNSIQSDTSPGANSNKPWFQTNYVAGVSAGLPENFSLDTFVVFYTFPSGTIQPVSELDLQLSYDDTKVMEDAGLFALKPYALYAIELEDSNGAEGQYLELGLKPSVVVMESEDYPVTLAVPIRNGLGLSHYYGGETVWGFTSVGVEVSMPLAMVPVEYGAWRLVGGVDAIFASDDARQAAASVADGGGQNDVEWVGKVSLQMSY
jgi:hypothetical protein